MNDSEMKELASIRSGITLTLKELTLIKKAHRDLREARDLLRKISHPSFEADAKKLGLKWGYTVS